MATLSDLVDSVNDKLYGIAQIERPREDTVATAVTDSLDVTWRMTTPSMWRRDDYLEPVGGSELVLMTTDHPDSGDVTVRRAQRGTTAASALSIGDPVYRNPMYPRSVIENEINEVIDNDLWPDVWMWEQATLSGGFVPGDTSYSLPADYEDVVQVMQFNLSGDQKFYPFPSGWWDVVSVPTAISSTGTLFRVYQVRDADQPVYYTAKKRPMSSDIPSLSDELVNMIPWQVTGNLLIGSRVVPQRSAPSRSPQAVSQSGDRLLRDYSVFSAKFEQMKRKHKLRLKKEVMALKKYRTFPRSG